MQTDKLLAAIARRRQAMFVVGGEYDSDSKHIRLAILDCMRAEALCESAVEFTNYCQYTLAGPRGDTISEILSELFEELGVPPTPNHWDDFAALYLT